MNMITPSSLKIVELLELLELGLSTVFDRLELDHTRFYHKEYIYNLRSLTRELKQEMQGGNFSLEYIEEKTQKLLHCANIISNGYRFEY